MINNSKIIESEMFSSFTVAAEHRVPLLDYTPSLTVNNEAFAKSLPPPNIE
ncbi:MAG: hypothetical protein PQJ46_14740 [Spirochaetales bacterium]|nr:hypothetical protein [Spirochaetales bacterium]